MDSNPFSCPLHHLLLNLLVFVQHSNYGSRWVQSDPEGQGKRQTYDTHNGSGCWQVTPPLCFRSPLMCARQRSTLMSCLRQKFLYRLSSINKNRRMWCNCAMQVLKFELPAIPKKQQGYSHIRLTACVHKAINLENTFLPLQYTPGTKRAGSFH